MKQQQNRRFFLQHEAIPHAFVRLPALTDNCARHTRKLRGPAQRRAVPCSPPSCSFPTFSGQASTLALVAQCAPRGPQRQFGTSPAQKAFPCSHSTYSPCWLVLPTVLSLGLHGCAPLTSSKRGKRGKHPQQPTSEQPDLALVVQCIPRSPQHQSYLSGSGSRVPASRMAHATHWPQCRM